MDLTRQLISFVGALLILIAYAGHQMGWIDARRPAYNILNARVGVRRGKWDVSLYGENLTDERALLALDRERGTRARIGYLTNQPRTFGLVARVDF